MLNKEALKSSLDSIVELGSDNFKIDNARAYYLLYNNTLEYIKRNMQPNGDLNQGKRIKKQTTIC